MTRIVVIVSFCFLATVCFGQEQKTYRDKVRNFSFVMPDGWTAVGGRLLAKEDKEPFEQTFKGEIVGLCHKEGTEQFVSPYIMVQAVGTGKTEETEVEEKLQSAYGKKLLRKRAKKIKDILPRVGEGARVTESEYKYDEALHASFSRIELDHQSVGEIVLVSVELLGSYRMITLHFYADGDDCLDISELVDEVVASFSYTEGYGFGEGKGEWGIGLAVDETFFEELKGVDYAVISGVFAVITVVFSGSLWVGLKYWDAECPFPALLLTAAVGSALNFIPWVGWAIAPFAMWGLLCKFSSAENWPDAFFVVIIAQTVRFVLLGVVLLSIPIGPR